MKRLNFSYSIRGPRSGAFLIVAMICLVLTSTLLGTLLKMAVLGRQLAQMEAASLQAEWLAESALDRAAAKLANQEEYKGETWNIPPEELGGHHAGQVVIRVLPGSNTNQRDVEVVARYPLEGPRTAKRTKRLAVAATPPEAAANPTDHAPAIAEKMGRGGDREPGR